MSEEDPFYFKTYENISQSLLLIKPFLRIDTHRPDAYFVNAVVVEGLAYTVGHLRADICDQKYTVIDPGNPTNRIDTWYNQADHFEDAGLLDLKCTGPSYDIGEPMIGEPVAISWHDLLPGGDMQQFLTSGHITGTCEIAGRHIEYAIPQPGNLRVTCGAAVRSMQNGKLLGIINKAIMNGGVTETIYMAPISEIIKLSDYLKET